MKSKLSTPANLACPCSVAHSIVRYHDENTKEEDLTHPEDIAHFRRHDEMEDEAHEQGKQDQLAVVESNIPQMFRRS